MFFQFIIAIIIVLILTKIYINHTMKNCLNHVSLIGRTVVVTGANTGIGFYSALEFAKRGARVILTCRNAKTAENTKEELVKQTQNSNIVVHLLDLSSLSSVKQCAQNILDSEAKIDILVNNAGAAGLSDKTTVDNLQLLMQINYFGPVLFTFLLLKLLKKSPNGRIINVSSMMANMAKFTVNTLNDFQGYYLTYAKSKLCNIFFTMELSQKLRNTSVSVFSLHPGAVKTNVFRRIKGFRKLVLNFVAYFTFKTADEGAQTTIYTATELGLEKHSGKHFEDCQIVPPYTAASNEKLAKEVWDETLKILYINQDFYLN